MSNAVYSLYVFLDIKKITVYLTNKISPKNMEEKIKINWWSNNYKVLVICLNFYSDICLTPLLKPWVLLFAQFSKLLRKNISQMVYNSIKFVLSYPAYPDFYFFTACESRDKSFWETQPMSFIHSRRDEMDLILFPFLLCMLTTVLGVGGGAWRGCLRYLGGVAEFADIVRTD